MNKKAITRGQVILTAIIILALSLTVFANTNTSSNDSSLSQEELNTALLDAFNNLNLSLTNIYLNETYLNETYITNNQYTTNVDNSTYNEFITQVTNQYFLELEPVIISGLDNITLNETQFSEIDFYIKNSMLSSITDSNGLDLTKSLESINSPNFENSFFLNPSDNTIVTNNVIVNDANINTGQDALIHDDENPLDLQFNNTMIDTNLYMNIAFEWNENEDLFEIRENGIAKIKLESQGSDEIMVTDLVNNMSFGAIEISENCDSNNEFCMIRFSFEDTTINVYHDDRLVGSFDNEFLSTPSQINIVGIQDNNKNFYIRSLYVQDEEITITPATFELDSEIYDFYTEEWTNVNIKNIGSTTYYKIGNEYANIDYIGEYSIDLDFTKTSVANLFARDLVN
jgi:hypothetical protein